MMMMMRLFFPSLLIVGLANAAAQPCRPTCLAFKVDRSAFGCGQAESSVWSIRNSQQCTEGNETSLPPDFKVVYTEDIRQMGFHVNATQDSLSVCSIVSCPPDECRFPEQFVSRQQNFRSDCALPRQAFHLFDPQRSMVQFDIFDPHNDTILLLSLVRVILPWGYVEDQAHLSRTLF